MTQRRATWLLGSLLATLLVAGCTGSTAPAPVASPLPEPRPAAVPTFGPVGSQAPSPTSAGLAAALRAALADPRLGPGAGLAVLDLASGRNLLDRASGVAVPPASTAKLLTATAALRVLGADHRLSTQVRRQGDLVVLVGGGDPTLAGPRSVPRYPASARLVDLAAATARALGPGSRVQVAVDDRLFSGPRTALGWKPNYIPEGDVAPVSALELDGGRLRPDDNPRTPDLRAADPALHAGSVFAGLLRARGVTVVGGVRRATSTGSAKPIAVVESPPVGELVESMLSRSDNDLAEALARQVALARKLPPTFEGAAAAVTAAVGELGIHGVVLHDASGLSTRDRLTPRQLVDVVALAAGADHPELRPIITGLPVAGFSGTLATRFSSAAPARGLVRAKTGTLAGVSTLAGLVLDADRRLLAFAVTAPHAPSSWGAQGALDRLLAVLASCGCR